MACASKSLSNVPTEWLQHVGLDYVSALLKFDPSMIIKLNQLVERNKIADNEATNLIQILLKIKDEYKTSAELAKNLLRRLYLTPEQMSTNAQKHLKQTSISDQLKYVGEDPTMIAIIEAITTVEAAKIAMQEASVKRHIRDASKSSADLREQIAVFQRELILLRSEYNAFQEDTEKKVYNAKVYEMKSKKLHQKLQELQEVMNRQGIQDVSKYKEVLDNYEECNKIKLEVSKLQEELLKYDQLPTNLEEAKKTLLEIKWEHEQLVKQISSKFTLPRTFQ